MEANPRLRLVFQNRKILSESQMTDGLKRSWILLNPRHETISDLADHLVHAFDLRDACPDGLVLSMDGFVLPPFESTSILKENDVIRVKKRRSIDIPGLPDGRNCFELEDAVEEQLVNGAMKLLANEEFEKESGGYQSESEGGEPEKLEDVEDQLKKTISKKRKASEEFEKERGGYQSESEEGEPEKLEDVEDTPKKTVSKKRKASKKLKSSNDSKRRKKSAITEEGPNTLADAGNEIQPEQNGSSHHHLLLPEESPVDNGKLSNTNDELDSSSESDSDERKKKVELSTPSEKRSCQVQENGKLNVVSSDSYMPDGSKKFPSRSTRRRKLRRQWKKEQAKLRESELQQTQLNKRDNQQSSGKDNSKSVEEHQQPDESNDEEGEIVPVVVRPGHIRFEPFDKVDADQAVQHHEISVETFQWNGITSKKKGQKWGKEKTVSYKRSEQKNLNQELSDALVNAEETTVNVPVDFNKLKPCTTLPQEGDTVAYRLIELSSSWTPELSLFRVGKVSKYDPKSEKLTLVQVPEYPIVFEKDGDEESAAKSDTSPYNEDGSLEIDYLSLVDVRIVKHGNLSSAKSVTPDISKATWGDSVASSSRSRPNSKKKGPKGKEPKISAQENGKVNSWDDICKALTEKKAQLAKEDNWNRTGSTSRNSWSYRALRGSAMGPTMAILRAQNEI